MLSFVSYSTNASRNYIRKFNIQIDMHTAEFHTTLC